MQITRWIDRLMDGWMDGWMDVWMDRSIDRSVDWIDQINRQTDRQTDRQRDRQTDRQIENIYTSNKLSENVGRKKRKDKKVKIALVHRILLFLVLFCFFDQTIIKGEETI